MQITWRKLNERMATLTEEEVRRLRQQFGLWNKGETWTSE